MARVEVRALSALLLPALLLLAAPATAVVLTGEVRAVDAQAIYTPPANMSPVVLRYFVPEGERVRKGDVVLRIDPGQAGSQVRELESQIVQAGARAAKELAGLRVAALDARIALVDAEAALEVAKVDAGIPRALLAALDHDRYQGELDRARREHALKRNELATAEAAVVRRARDGELEAERLRVQRDYNAAQVLVSEVRADRDGVVIHGFNNNWIGGRIDEGSSTMPGSKAGEVVGGGEMHVRAWALVPDRRGLEVGQDVRIAFDALPGRTLTGRITDISGAPERRAEWGEGRYFAIDIALPRHDLTLLPGMSVRVVTKPVGAAPAGAAKAAKAFAGVPAPTGASALRIDGEVYAQRTSALMPPAVDTLWQFNITQLAPDGAPVEKGQAVLAFDGNQLMQQLTAKNSQLAEKERELERLVLDLAERERNERLVTAEAAANLDKAERKTSQPREAVAGIEYRKLVVARAQAERKLALARQREQLAAVQRREERRLLASEVTDLRGDIAELQGWIASLNVAAPRAGLMMHKSSWNGEKFDVGSQVWRGQAVAEIPDTSTLAVRGELPERDLQRVAVGAPVRVVVEGGAGIAVDGKVASIGRAVRSKSRVQPVPVLDVEVTLEDPAASLKPGQAVRLDIGVAR